MKAPREMNVLGSHALAIRWRPQQQYECALPFRDCQCSRARPRRLHPVFGWSEALSFLYLPPNSGSYMDLEIAFVLSWLDLGLWANVWEPLSNFFVQRFPFKMCPLTTKWTIRWSWCREYNDRNHSAKCLPNVKRQTHEGTTKVSKHSLLRHAFHFSRYCEGTLRICAR